MSYSRARVAISRPGFDPDIKDPNKLCIHVGHACTMYLGSRLAQTNGCPFDVRLDGPIKHEKGDLSRFVLEIVECLQFLGIPYRKVYWHRQEPYDQKWLDGRFTEREQRLLRHIRWDEKSPLDTLAILDDVEHAPSLIVRAMEFVEPEKYVGRKNIGDGVRWFKELEQTIFSLTGSQNHEINVPLITMGGYKMSKEEGRAVHWSALKTLGRTKAVELFEKIGKGGPTWEWAWDVLGGEKPLPSRTERAQREF